MSVSRWYYWVSGFFLLNSMAAFGFIDRLVYGVWENKPGDKITQTLNLLLIISSLTLFGRGYFGKREIGAGGVFALVTTGFLFLSAGWSYDPAATVRTTVLYLSVVLGSIGVAATLDPDEYMDLLTRICFLSAVASLVLVAVSPSNAIEPDFHGIFPNKNFLGQVMATGALASLHVLRVDHRRRVRKIFMLLVFIGMAIESASATACLAIFVFCCADWTIALFRKGGASLFICIILMIVLLPILVVSAIDPGPILEMIGKDSTLTGRTDIWTHVIDEISLKPLLGWGYYGFWSANNPAVIEISAGARMPVGQSHNGLLEMLLSVGVIGAAIFIFLFVRNVILAFRCFRTSTKALAISSIILCVGILVIGVSEPVLLSPVQPWTSMFFVTGFMCERVVHAARRTNYKAFIGGRPVYSSARISKDPLSAERSP
jgi:O-antigen ligase